MSESENISDVINSFLQRLPPHTEFNLPNEYKKMYESITGKMNHLLLLSISLYETKVIESMKEHHYLKIKKNGYYILSKHGLNAKRLGHEIYQNKLIDVEDEKLNRREFKIGRLILVWTIIGIIIATLISILIARHVI